MNTSDIDLYLKIKKHRSSARSLLRLASISVFVIVVSGSTFGFTHWAVVFLAGFQAAALLIGVLMHLGAKFEWARGHSEELLDIVERQIDRDEEASRYLTTFQAG